MRFKSHYSNPLVVYELSDGFTKLLKEHLPQGFDRKDVIFACIGTDRCIGDAVGPLVGTYLQEMGFDVVGTIQEPMHALNLPKRLEEMKQKYPDRVVVGIDACLGDTECIGEIHVRDYAINPGRGVGKTLPSVGKITFIAIVDSSETSELFTNRNIRLSLIMSQSKVICDAICRSFADNKKVAPPAGFTPVDKNFANHGPQPLNGEQQIVKDAIVEALKSEPVFEEPVRQRSKKAAPSKTGANKTETDPKEAVI